jgi:hypothetical protein
MIYKKKTIIETMIYWLNLSPQATYVMNFIEFNNIFFLNYFFIVFAIYFSINLILKYKIKKKLLKK